VCTLKRLDLEALDIHEDDPRTPEALAHVVDGQRVDHVAGDGARAMA